MEERYWDASGFKFIDFENKIKDIVNENVIEALKELIDQGDIYLWSLDDKEDLEIVFASYDKPNELVDNGCTIDNWRKERNLFDAAMELAEDYGSLGKNLSENQFKDVKKRCDFFDKLATEFRKKCESFHGKI